MLIWITNPEQVWVTIFHYTMEFCFSSQGWIVLNSAGVKENTFSRKVRSLAPSAAIAIHLCTYLGELRFCPELSRSSYNKFLLWDLNIGGEVVETARAGKWVSAWKVQKDGAVWREMGRKRRLRCETWEPLSAVDGKGTDGYARWLAGWGWQCKDPRPRGSRTTVPRAFPGVGILLDDITREEREDRVVVGLVRRFAIDFPTWWHLCGTRSSHENGGEVGTRRHALSLQRTGNRVYGATEEVGWPSWIKGLFEVCDHKYKVRTVYLQNSV